MNQYVQKMSVILGVALGLLLSGCQSIRKVSTPSNKGVAEYQSAQISVATPTVESSASAGSISWTVSSTDPAMYRNGGHLVTVHNTSADKVVVMYPGNIRIDPQGSIMVNPRKLLGVGTGSVVEITFKYFQYERDSAKQKEVFSQPPVGMRFCALLVFDRAATRLRAGWDPKGDPTIDRSETTVQMSGF